MKKFLAQFFVFSVVLLSISLFSSQKAHAAVRVEVEPNTITYGGTIKVTAFGCNSGKVDFYWQSGTQQAAKSGNYYKQTGVDISPSSENPATIVSVYNLNTDTLTNEDWYIHAYCKATNENSPNTKFTVTDKKGTEAVTIPASVDGYSEFRLDYTGFQQGQCYYVTVLPKSGSLVSSNVNKLGIQDGGSDLPNYTSCNTVTNNSTYFTSNTLPANGKLTIHPLPPGSYAIQVGRPAGGGQVQLVGDKTITVKDSTNAPEVQIAPNILQTNAPGTITVKGCPANSSGYVKWSKKDSPFTSQEGQRAVSFTGSGTTTITQSFATQNNNQLWVECGVVRSPYFYFSVTNQNITELPQVFITLADKSVKKQGDIIKFPAGSAVTISATNCPNDPGNSTKANFNWKHSTAANAIFVQAGSKENIPIDAAGATEPFAITFKDDNYNQIQVSCSDKSSLPLYFTVGDPEGLTTDKSVSPTPTPTAKPVYAPCVEGLNAAGNQVVVIKPGENPDQKTIDSRLKDIVTCTKVGSGIGSINTDPASFIKFLFQLILSLSGGIALLVMIRAGYKYMTSQGNAEALKSAQEEITSAVVGLLFLIFSMVLLQVIGVDVLQLPDFSTGKTTTTSSSQVKTP